MTLRLALSALVAAASLAAQAPDTARYTILMAKGVSGIQKAWTDPDGARKFYLEFNDRGRGPALTQRVVLGPDGYPTSVEITGHDYMKVPVDERFTVTQGGAARTAAWKNAAEASSVARS